MSGRSIVQRYSTLRDRVLERLRKVNVITERGAIDAGTKLERIVEIARTHITEVRDVLMRPITASDSTLRAALDAQAAHASKHCSELDRTVKNHAAEVSGVAESAQRITMAAREIERASTAARVLAVNARIESARSGAHVFKSMAIEMAELSRSIATANTRIRELATAMETTLPRLAKQSETLRDSVASFGEQTHTHIASVDREISALRRSAEATLAASDGTLAGIISSSQAALSALQFQDVAAQSLLQIDRWEAEALRDTANELEVDVDIPAGAGSISTEDSILDHANAGDVMLF